MLDDKKNGQKTEDANENTEKKLKIKYELEENAVTLITADTNNKKYWDDCMEYLEKGKKVFICFKYF